MENMRIFVFHNTNMSERDVQILNQLLHKLKEIGSHVISSSKRADNESFLEFLNRELSSCQWFILFQTSEVIHSSEAKMTVNTALKLVERRQMLGALRLIVTTNELQVLPSEWSKMTEFDATYDYPRALEKLQIVLSTGKPSSDTANIGQAPLPTYDRPPIASSPWQNIKTSFPSRQQSNLHAKNRRNLLLPILIAFVVIALLGSSLILFMRKPPISTRPQSVTEQTYGTLHFFNTNLLGNKNLTGISDGLQIDLHNLQSPTPGNSYYAWLLPDKKEFDGLTRSIGKLTLTNGTVHLQYESSSHDNLLATNSQFLITEESTSVIPDSPSADKSVWRYYAGLPQIPNPTDTRYHYSNLDHLRHLLAAEPNLKKLSFNGGLSVWFFQNVGKVLEWASAVRGTGTPQQPDLMHRNLVRILDYLDGTSLVRSDVPHGTPILANAPVALLTLDPNSPGLPGYIHHIEIHLLALTDAPNTPAAQRKLAGQIDAELNKVKVSLEQVRQDAKQLVRMTNAQLLDPANISLLDDLHNQATAAYIGQLDPTTGSQQGGATWIYNHIPLLAELTVTKYSA